MTLSGIKLIHEAYVVRYHIYCTLPEIKNCSLSYVMHHIICNVTFQPLIATDETQFGVKQTST